MDNKALRTLMTQASLLSLGGGYEADLESLEEGATKLLRLTSQKTAGQRGNGDLPWEELERVRMQICAEACCLVLDPRFQALKEKWTEVIEEQ